MKDKLIFLQIALFFSELESRPDRLANHIEDALSNVQFSMPSILPIPADAPADIPRVNMSSEDGRLKIDIAKNRIDMVIQFINSSDSPTYQVDSFVDQARSFATTVFSYKKINRFGMVGQYFFKKNEPTKSIVKKYLKVDLGSLHEITVRYNKRFKISGFDLNDVIEINQGDAIVQNQKPVDGIFVNRDINNVLNDELKIEHLMQFLSSCKGSFMFSSIKDLVE